MRYFLIGLPGSGKSHWGKIWADKMKLTYFDLDELIENNEGFSISEIFQNDGEAHFRNLETFYLNKVIDNYQAFILSTGGGTACFNNNIELMNASGRTLFLDPPIEKIVARIWKPNKNKRPLFSHCNNLSEALEAVKQLNTERKKYYQQAKFALNTWDELTLKKINSQ